MDIIEAARKLGVELQKDPRFIEYAKARLESDNNEDLQKMIGEFNLIRLNIEQEHGKEETDELKLKELNADLRELYDKIMATDSMQAYNKAKTAVDKMLNDINIIIAAAADGEDPETFELPEACTGSCATCGGCH